VRRIVDGGEPAAQVARALDIRVEMLHTWARQLKVRLRTRFVAMVK
jgi:hypothetical protein